MASANTYYDANNTISLVAGTWLIVAQCSVNDSTSTGGNTTFRLWDGTTAISSLAQSMNSGGVQSATLSGIVVLASTKTYRVSVAATQPGHVILIEAPQNTAGIHANYIAAIKIA
jgi:hypothetical protein